MKFYNKTWFLVLTFFLFPPAFIWGVWTHPTFGKKVKIGWIGLWAVIFCMGLFSESSEDDSTQSVESSVSTEDNQNGKKNGSNLKDYAAFAQRNHLSESELKDFIKALKSVGIDSKRIELNDIGDLIVHSLDNETEKSYGLTVHFGEKDGKRIAGFMYIKGYAIYDKGKPVNSINDVFISKDKESKMKKQIIADLEKKVKEPKIENADFVINVEDEKIIITTEAHYTLKSNVYGKEGSVDRNRKKYAFDVKGNMLK